MTLPDRLLAWFRRRRRDLPWRREPRDPYRVWISEVMLQQTRVETVLPYYERFLREFPSPAALARAPERRVLACWSGLGYYSRARNLRLAARVIARDGFPRDYEGLRALPGVGEYTAAAIASIAFGLPCPALDGNAVRVVARMTNDRSNVRMPATRRRFEETVRGWLRGRRPGDVNEALMELGATVCLPREPRCPSCPVAACCRARVEGTARELPVKPPRREPRRIEAALAVVTRGGKLLVRQRGADEGRLAGFWELPALEEVFGLRAERTLGSFTHTITHHYYTFTVVSGSAPAAPPGMRWLSKDELAHLPVTTASRKALAFLNVPAR